MRIREELEAGHLTESDFANLPESVQEKFGEVRDSKLAFTGIAWHGNQSATMSLNYDTQFTHGCATERFV